MFDRNVVQDLEYRKELADRFNAEQEGIQVTVDVIPQGYDPNHHGPHRGRDRRRRFPTCLPLRDEQVHHTRGLLQELDEFVALDDYDLSVFIEGPLSSNRVNGKLFALPVNGHAGHAGLYFAPEIFADAGVDLPTDDWTYDDLRDAAAKLTRDTDDDGKSDSWGIWFGAWYQGQSHAGFRA